MSANFSGAARYAWQGAAALLLGAMVSLGAYAQAPVGDRPDIGSFSPAQRADLYTQMTNYITASVILEHLNPPNDKHGSSRFTVWHRRYIKAMEDYLISQNRPQFVPLPRWDPSTLIPVEFYSVNGGVDLDCPTAVFTGQLCSGLANTNPAKSLPASLSSLLCSQTPYTSFRSTLEGSYHNPVHGAVGGVMGNFKSPAAPIFWLWHAFVDDVWYDWQCMCGLDEGSAFNTYTAAERSTNLDAGTADAWMQDDLDDIGNEPNAETGPVIYQSTDIWVRNTAATPVGTTRFLNEHQHQNPEYAAVPANRPYIYVKVRNRGCTTITGQIHVYWANASTGLLWPTAFTEVSTSPVTLTNIKAGREHVAQFHWLDIPQPTTTSGNHFCLIARFVATPASADPIVGESVNVDVAGNVRNSNQIAWKNLTVVDDVANNWVIVRNISHFGEILRLRFGTPLNQDDDTFFDHGMIMVTLGDSLFAEWVANGGQGAGIEYNDCGQLRVLVEGATIDGLPMTYLEEHLVGLQFLPGAGAAGSPCEDDRTVYNVEVNAYEGQTLLGGNGYEIHPEVIRPSPVVTIVALDPQIRCNGGTVRLRVTSAVPPGATLQWLRDDAPIPGATGINYTATVSGMYRVLMTYSNGCDRLSEAAAVRIEYTPANDNPCTATYLALGAPADLDIYCATAQGPEVHPGAGTDSLGSCYSRDGWCENDTEVQNSVWYRFTAPPSGTVSIHAGMVDHDAGHDNAVNSQLAVYQVGDCAHYGTYTLVAANDDSGNHGMWGTDPALHDLAGLTAGADYYIQVDGYLGQGGSGTIVVEAVDTTDIPDGSTPSVGPSVFDISSVVPNPSAGSFAVRLALPRAADVGLRLIDVAGRAVAARSFGSLPAGYHDLSWDTTESGSRIARGVYYLEVRAGEERQVRKIVLR